MKLVDKIEPAKTAIRFISRHDDESQETVDSALDGLAKYIESERAEGKTRRAAKASAAVTDAKKVKGAV